MSKAKTYLNDNFYLKLTLEQNKLEEYIGVKQLLEDDDDVLFQVESYFNLT